MGCPREHENEDEKGAMNRSLGEYCLARVQQGRQAGHWGAMQGWVVFLLESNPLFNDLSNL